jgi:segregation and condensation protein B
MSDDTPENQDELVRAVEACLFAAEEPLTREQISAHLGDADVSDALTALQEQYAKRGVVLVERGKRWAFQTAPDLAHILRREKDQLRRLSRAATEVLAIVAYHEPVSRAEIEAIRGVQTSGGTLDVLMEAGWVRVAGRREVPGRPVIYATTPEFLAHFGLESRKDLPGLAELKASGLLDPVDDAYEDLMEQKAAEECDVVSDAEAEPEERPWDRAELLEDKSSAETLEKPDESA